MSWLSCEVAHFKVPGEPRAQPRAKAFVRGKHAAVYNPDTADDWKGAVIRSGASRRPESPIENPVELHIEFFLKRPKRLYRKKDPDGPVPHTAKPDRDNLEKAVLDALASDGWFRDDCVVCGGEVRKWYHAKDGIPCAWITIRELIPTEET